MRYTLMHISDLHAGPAFHADAAAAATRQAHELRPDLLIISGDLVQRAVFPGQWRAIRAYLDHLPEPRLVVPGNHDVPLLDGISRVFSPLRYYQRHISPDRTPIFTRPGLGVVGASSAHGLTIDAGWLYPRQFAALEQALASIDAAACKVVVFHHPLVDPPAKPRASKVGNARRVLKLLERQGVELFLCGHLHFSYIAEVQPASALDSSLIICQSGTTTSKRGRGPDKGKNSFHLIELDAQTIRIVPHFYDATARQFLPAAERVFTR